MKSPIPRFLSLFAASTLLFCSAPSVFASDENGAPEVRLIFVQGDVRLSLGDGKNPALDKDWQQAESGLTIEQGYSLATGDGRAEIEFESGGTVYLAENSLLLFKKFTLRENRSITRVALVSGTATFSLKPSSDESFFIETPTENIEITSPETFFARMDAYLDATAITPQGEKGESVVRRGSPSFQIAKGQTLFFQGGEVIQPPGSSHPIPSDWIAWFPPATAVLNVLGLFPDPPAVLDFLKPRPAEVQPVVSRRDKEAQSYGGTNLLLASDWDTWVAARVKERETTAAAALRASGLSAAVPGLADMYANGSFFPCEPYGTCWEPTERETQQSSGPQTPAPTAPSPNLNTANTVFQPQTVEWTARIPRYCRSDAFVNVSRVAHTPQELEELLRQKELAGRQALKGASFSDSCLQHGVWIHHQGHYARVLAHRVPPVCVGKGCKVVHPPRPVWVRVNGKLGFVPRHPNDVKGKPPVNLKNGIVIPAGRRGGQVQHLALDPSQKVKFLDKTPKEFRSISTPHLLSASPPKIQAHLMQEATQAKSLTAANHADSHILYDYKSHNFIMPANASAGAKSKEVAIGGITSHGGVRSFADGRSGHYADSFGHSTAAASYSGGGHNSGSPYGGGHGSGSYSSSSSYSHGGGGSGSSYSGGGGSSGAHSSGGSSSSASASSASSSSSCGSCAGGSPGGRSGVARILRKNTAP
jgi:hypothetical protein